MAILSILACGTAPAPPEVVETGVDHDSVPSVAIPDTTTAPATTPGPYLQVWEGHAAIRLNADHGEDFEVAVVDLDGDAVDDYVLWRRTPDDVERDKSDLVVFMGGREGTVAAGDWDFRQADVVGTPYAVPDVDGDGADDVLVAGVGVFSGSQLALPYPLTEADAIDPTRYPETLVIGDENGDGFGDFITFERWGGVWDTDGGLQAWIYLWSGVPDTAGYPAYLGMTYDIVGGMRQGGIDWIYTADRDGDGNKEVWGTPGDNTWRVYSSTGLATQTVDLLQTVSGGSTGCDAGDLDGDGAGDLILAVDGALVAVLARDGDVDATSLPPLVPSAGSLEAPELIADIDGDGVRDVLAMAAGGPYTGRVRVSGALVLTGGVVDVDTPSWLLERTSQDIEIAPDGTSAWVKDDVGVDGLQRYAQVPLAGSPGVLDVSAATLTFDPVVPILGSKELVARWWGDGEDPSLILLARAAPYGLATLPFRELQVADDELITTWERWSTDGPVGWLPDLDHDGEPEVLLQVGERVSRWSIDVVDGAGVELATVEEVATTDLVTWEGGGFCDLTGDGIDDPLSSTGPIDGASVLDATAGIVLLAAMPDLGGCLGDLDGDGVGDLVSASGVQPAVLYSGAEAAAGRATVIYTWPDGASAGTVTAVDADGDGDADVPWLDDRRAGWVAELPASRPEPRDLLLGVIGARRLASMEAWPPDGPTAFAATTDPDVGAGRNTRYFGLSAGWRWWDENTNTLYVDDERVLSTRANPDPLDTQLVLLAVYDAPEPDAPATSLIYLAIPCW